ncbi:protein phosphatase 2C domain-containing protein [Streptacidiphilus monticola]
MASAHRHRPWRRPRRPRPPQPGRRAHGRGRGVQAVALADGHGHEQHFRSEAGALLAVDAACTQVRRLAAGPVPELPRLVVEHWRAAVAGHLAQQPYSAEELASIADGDAGSTVPYGSTLLLAAVAPPWLLCLQLGDGDALLVRPDGSARSPSRGRPAGRPPHDQPVPAGRGGLGPAGPGGPARGGGGAGAAGHGRLRQRADRGALAAAGRRRPGGLRRRVRTCLVRRAVAALGAAVRLGRGQRRRHQHRPAAARGGRPWTR